MKCCLSSQTDGSASPANLQNEPNNNHVFATVASSAHDSQKTRTESCHEFDHNDTGSAIVQKDLDFREQNASHADESKVAAACKDAKEPVSEKQIKGFDGIPREWYTFEKVFNEKTNRYSTTF